MYAKMFVSTFKKDYNMDMRILVVEDDKKVARFLQKGLEEEHYTVDVCRNGQT